MGYKSRHFRGGQGRDSSGFRVARGRANGGTVVAHPVPHHRFRSPPRNRTPPGDRPPRGSVSAATAPPRGGADIALDHLQNALTCKQSTGHLPYEDGSRLSKTLTDTQPGAPCGNRSGTIFRVHAPGLLDQFANALSSVAHRTPRS